MLYETIGPYSGPNPLTQNIKKNTPPVKRTRKILLQRSNFINYYKRLRRPFFEQNFKKSKVVIFNVRFRHGFNHMLKRLSRISILMTELFVRNKGRNHSSETLRKTQYLVDRRKGLVHHPVFNVTKYGLKIGLIYK